MLSSLVFGGTIGFHRAPLSSFKRAFKAQSAPYATKWLLGLFETIFRNESKIIQIFVITSLLKKDMGIGRCSICVELLSREAPIQGFLNVFTTVY